MDVADERDEIDDEPAPVAEPPKRGRGRPPGSKNKRKHVSTRFERRAEKVEQTVRELVKLGKPELDIGDKSFVEIVNRDADSWGRFFAQIAEWLPPFGSAIDLTFGSALVTVLNMLPSFRAARRELREARERRRAEREREYEEQALREELAQRDEQTQHGGVFEPPPAVPLGVVEAPPTQTRELTREEWLGGNGTV